LKKTKIAIYGLGALALVGVAIGFGYQSRKQYEMVSPRTGPIEEAIYGIGTVESQNKFSFKLATPKTIDEVFAEEGSSVQKNQVLLKFDDGTVVRSPLNGTLKSFPYRKGENAFTDRPVVEVEDQKKLFLEVALDQESSLRVSSHQKALISF
jgi:multidrug efflux pump subunit AcrA (membrane-fusion protein)